ncbi:protein kinase domain-containing protein [Nocardia jejuensis]|uniref:protein kinase domain-containing protein n=1 Tax=Nocardia jejuensis TaxID=328049 RepID=UPI000833B394|nr:protein kinase [Nocardia jejuensis]
MSDRPAHAVARFVADWESTLRGDRDEPPHLPGYVPDGEDIRLSVLADLVRVDMSQRWRRAGLEKRITEYRREFPEVVASPQFADLVCDEYLVRSRHRPVDVDAFAAEYPEVAEEVRRRFAAGGPLPAPPPDLPAGIETGRRLDDFDLLTDLGGDSHHRMFLARQRSMQRLVAVRVEAGPDSDIPTVAQLDHHHIVRVFDQRLIREQTTGNPLRLLYMQYLPGGTAADLFARLRAPGVFGGTAESVSGGTAASRASGTAAWSSGGTAAMSSGGTAASSSGGTAASSSGGTAPSSSGGTAAEPGAAPIPTDPLTPVDALPVAEVPAGSAVLARPAPDAPLAHPFRDRLSGVRAHRGSSNGSGLHGGSLLRAVDAAMEAKGEIRPVDSSVRAEIEELSWPETVAWVGRRLAAALDYAERQGVSHHDIRPGNVIFTAEGVPKLADFALGPVYWSGVLSGRGSAGERPEVLRYRSPEALTAMLDPTAPAPGNRSDIYSLGLVLWEMLTGTIPFDDDSDPVLESTEPAVAESATRQPAVLEVEVPESAGAGSSVPESAAHESSVPKPAVAESSGPESAVLESVREPAVAEFSVLESATLESAVAGFVEPSADVRDGSPTTPESRLVTAMVARRLAGVPESALAALPSDTPATLRRVLLECLSPEPEQRWQSGSDLAGQLDLCLDARARDLVDPPPSSWRSRLRGWPVPIAALCVGLPNAVASLYNIRLNQSLIVDRLTAADQDRFATVAVVNNAVAFPIAALLMVWMARRPLMVTYRLARGHLYSVGELARARADTLHMGEWTVWIPFGMWILAGVAWPLGLQSLGTSLPPGSFAHFFAAQLVCAAIALAYPFFPITVFAVRSLYPQLLARGAVGAADRGQLLALARRSNFYLAAAASVPLLGVATATFVSTEDLELVIVPVRWLSAGGILAFFLTYRLFRMLEADLLALARAIPQGAK